MNYNANSIYPSTDTVYLSNGKFFKWDLDNQKWLDVETAVYNYVDYFTGIRYINCALLILSHIVIKIFLSVIS